MRYCIIWIVLLLAPAWAAAEEISVTITVGGVKITYEGCDGTFLESSRQSESVSITGKGMEDGFTRITREARKIAKGKEETRDAFVKDTYAKFCIPPRVVTVREPYLVDRPVYVDRPVVTERVVYVDRPVPACPAPMAMSPCPYGPIPCPVPSGIHVRRWISNRSFICTGGHTWTWDPVRCLWFDP
ncbi:MAG: hypothetical protein WCV62_00695 [Candidatus Peribacteraceae bacterium]|jgi:hypothetical protein